MENRLCAWWFARYGARNEARGNAQLRTELLAGAAGRVLEVGVGTGLNLAHYPATVEQLIAAEPEPTMRQNAAEAAARAPVPVRIVAAFADALPVGDGSQDAVVVSGLLCSVPDPAAALADSRARQNT
ncbi:class I SAM-dependent methyltransferase [Amycolatopsis sp. GM8]|uniref:class I SAM-dependent methyltransferase n=1 Tax=Amycolatopsis sp. GM8 TaxID=2896530 RepID=UPI001F30A496|nr:methyltransferase domain-containing protein [Amycolatopsis sp. GM8]